jgi:hypothetical protein
VTVVMICFNCQHTNKQMLGMPGFELVNCRFETFSEAHQHMIANPDHYISMEVQESSEEE